MIYQGKSGVLAYQSGPPTITVVTVEVYCKWYGLYLVFPDGTYKQVPFPDATDFDPSATYESLGSPYVDHVPNPKHVQIFADFHQFYLDETAMDLITGRWQREVVDEYRPKVKLPTTPTHIFNVPRGKA